MLTRKGCNNDILNISYLTSSLPLLIQDTLQNLQLAEETILLNQESCRENAFFKIMQSISGGLSSQTQAEDLSKVKELQLSVEQLSKEFEAMQSFPETLFTFQQKVKDNSASLEEINCKHEHGIISQKQQEVVGKIFEISHSERKHELKKVLDEI